MCRVSIPLTLGVPPRPEPHALVAGLLLQKCHSVDDVNARFRALTSGPPVVSASVLKSLPPGVDLGRVVVELDIDPEELRARGGGTYESVRYHLDADSDTLADATALRVPSPLVVFPKLTDADALDIVTAIVDAHRTPGFAASSPPRRIADILAVVAHSEVGFTARAESGSQVLSVIAATVAALRGDDITAAIAEPNVRALAALRPEAADAVRSVLLAIEVDDAAAAHRDLVDAGLVPAEAPRT